MSFNAQKSETDPLLQSINTYQDKGYDGAYVGIAKANKIKRNSLRVIYFTMFIGSISFSIVMSSLWPFLRTLDGDVNETFLGYVNAGYSLSQMVAGIFFGYWCDHYRHIQPFLFSTVLLAAGSLLYSYAQAFGHHGIWVVFGARILLGLSGGNISVARSAGALMTSSEERGKIMAYLSLWQATGFFIGPALQALSKVAGTKGLYVGSIHLYLNIYTAPCYLLLVLGIINFILILVYFKEPKDCKVLFQNEQIRLRRESESFELPNFKVILVCLALWFVAMSIFALNETILSPVLMYVFGWSRDKTVFYGAIILSVSGVIAVLCFLVVDPLIKKFSARIVTFGGYVLLLAGFILYMPWGPGHMKLAAAYIYNGTAPAKHSTGGGGCPYNYPWCTSQPALSFGQFLVGATFIMIGYPVACVTMTILYSSIIGPFPQGKYMGWLTGIGCLARVGGPLYVTAVYEHFGLRWTSAGVDVMLLLALILFAINWRKLVPYGTYIEMNQPLYQAIS